MSFLSIGFHHESEEVRAQEIQSAGGDERKKKKLEDEFTPRFEMTLVAVEGKLHRQLKLRVQYRFDAEFDYGSMADEPTGNLDSRNGEAVMDLLRELHREGATICMVTHDPRYARYADRTVHLFDGKVVDETFLEENAAK